MRYGLCTSMAATAADVIGFSYAPVVKELGYDYVELPLAELMSLSDIEFGMVAKRLKDLGLRCEVCNNFFPRELRLTGNGVDDAQVKRYYERALARAARLGARVVVFGSGRAKNVPPGFPTERAWGQLALLLERIDPILRREGMTLALEPLNKKECNIINTFGEACELALLAGAARNVKVLVDYFHMVKEEEAPAVLVKERAWLAHIHLSCPVAPDGMERAAMAMADGWNYDAFVRAVKAAGYRERISVEAYFTDFRAQAERALKFLRFSFS